MLSVSGAEVLDAVNNGAGTYSAEHLRKHW